MEWKLGSVLKGEDEKGCWYNNLVGLIFIRQEKQPFQEYIYKVSRLPTWKPFWEYMISMAIKERIPGIKNFARVQSVHPLLMDVDKDWKTLPSCNTSRQMLRYVSVQKIIDGIPFANQIKYGCSEESFFSSLNQLLAALSIADCFGFTHYDLHPNNVIIQKEKSKDNQFYLYDNEIPVLIPSCGYRAKIIDYEYAFCEAAIGKSFDSKLDLIDRGYLPCCSNNSYDSLRLVISCCSYMSDKCHSLACANIVSSLLLECKTGIRAFDSAGLPEESSDLVRDFLFEKLQAISSVFVIDFVTNRYYQILAILLHVRKLPFGSISGYEHNNSSICLYRDLIERVLEFDDRSERCCVAFFEFVDGNNEIYKKPEIWKAELGFMVQTCSDFLQSLYVSQCEKINKETTKNEFTAVKVQKWLQSQYRIPKDIRTGDIVQVMQKHKRTMRKLEISPAIEKALNSDYDIYRRGSLIKKLLDL